MNLLQQFPSQSESPVLPPPRAATSAAMSLRQQPIKHAGVQTRTALLLFAQWQPFIQPPFAVSTARGFEELLEPFLDPHARVVTDPMSSERSGELPHNSRNPPHQETGQDSELTGVEQAYVLQNRSAIPAFIKRNRLLELLLEAREPLVSAFGEAPVKKLTLVEDDEGFTSLFCLILISGSLDEAKRALNSFDDGWWLAHSHEAAGKLNFDFELI